jgi:hypothetical protein
MRNHGWHKGCKYTIAIHPSILPCESIDPIAISCTREREPHAMRLQSAPTCESRLLLWKGKNSGSHSVSKAESLMSGFGIPFGPLFAWLHGNHHPSNNNKNVLCFLFAHCLCGKISGLGSLLISHMRPLVRKSLFPLIKFSQGHHPVDNMGAGRKMTSPLLTLDGMWKSHNNLFALRFPWTH